MATDKDIRLLVSQIGRGDQHAFGSIFNQYSNKVYVYALRLTRSESIAEEIVQDVFMKLWVNRELLLEVDNFEPYLYQMTRNRTFNMLRQIAIERNFKNIIGKELSKMHDEMQEAILPADYQQILDKALERLPPQQRLVYNLCHQQGMKYEEVACQLNISRLTVKTHMQQALRSIRGFIQSTVTTFLLFLSLA